MKLLASLMAGFAAAANGTARIYQRGTSTEVAYYQDFEGDTVVAATTEVDLDAYGSAKVYVDQYVRVIVKNSAGTTLYDYVDGDSASATELRSLAFNGTDYGTAAVAPGNPLTVKAAFDKLLTSFGTTDFNVLIGGSAVTLQSFVANSAGIYFNVQNPDYSGGAAGDGVTDDTDAIEDAIAAAAVSGGIVFFPAGTYVTTSEISVPENVILQGVGSGASIVYCDASGAEDVFSCSSADGSASRSFRDITIFKSSACSGAYVNCGDVETYFERCVIGGGTAPGGHVLLGDARKTVLDCTLNVTQDRSAVYSATKDDAELVMVDTRLVAQVGTWTTGFAVLDTGPLQVANCKFVNDSVTGTIRNIDARYGGTVIGCHFGDPTVGELLHCMLIPESGSGYVLTEGSNHFGDGTNPSYTKPFVLPSAVEYSDSLLSSLAERWLEVVDNSTTVTYPATYQEHGVWVVRKSSGGSTVTLVVPYPIAENQRMTIVFINKTASTFTLNVNDADGLLVSASAAVGNALAFNLQAATRVASDTTEPLQWVPCGNGIVNAA